MVAFPLLLLLATCLTGAASSLMMTIGGSNQYHLHIFIISLYQIQVNQVSHNGMQVKIIFTYVHPTYSASILSDTNPNVSKLFLIEFNTPTQLIYNFYLKL